jgi:hypothetical protein
LVVIEDDEDEDVDDDEDEDIDDDEDEEDIIVDAVEALVELLELVRNDLA